MRLRTVIASTRVPCRRSARARVEAALAVRAAVRRASHERDQVDQEAHRLVDDPPSTQPRSQAEWTRFARSATASVPGETRPREAPPRRCDMAGAGRRAPRSAPRATADGPRRTTSRNTRSPSSPSRSFASVARRRNASGDHHCTTLRRQPHGTPDRPGKPSSAARAAPKFLDGRMPAGWHSLLECPGAWTPPHDTDSRSTARRSYPSGSAGGVSGGATASASGGRSRGSTRPRKSRTRR